MVLQNQGKKVKLYLFKHHLIIYIYICRHPHKHYLYAVGIPSERFERVSNPNEHCPHQIIEGKSTYSRVLSYGICLSNGAISENCITMRRLHLLPVQFRDIKCTDQPLEEFILQLGGKVPQKFDSNDFFGLH